VARAEAVAEIANEFAGVFGGGEARALRRTRETCIWPTPTISPISVWVRSCSKRRRMTSGSRAGW
jgi:hypothetical protein